MKKPNRKQREALARANSDVTARAVGREDIDYTTDQLPTEHIARAAPESETVPVEAGGRMDTAKALALVRRMNDWLNSAVTAGTPCACGCCSLCAYRFIERHLPS